MIDAEPLKSGWLGEMPRDFVDDVLSIGHWVQFKKNEVIYWHGAESNDLFGVASGHVRLHIAMNEHEQRVAHIVGPGFWFGENELILKSSRIMEMAAGSDLKLFKVPSDGFYRLAEKKPCVWKHLAALAAQHQILAIGAADDLLLSSAEKRIAAVLLRLSGNRLNHALSPAYFEIPITQQEFSVAANLSRATAGRLLREMASRGEILIEYGRIQIKKKETLEAILVD